VVERTCIRYNAKLPQKQPKVILSQMLRREVQKFIDICILFDAAQIPSKWKIQNVICGS